MIIFAGQTKGVMYGFSRQGTNKKTLPTRLHSLRIYSIRCTSLSTAIAWPTVPPTRPERKNSKAGQRSFSLSSPPRAKPRHDYCRLIKVSRCRGWGRDGAFGVSNRLTSRVQYLCFFFREGIAPAGTHLAVTASVLIFD